MPSDSLTRERVLTLLAEAPERLDALTADRSPALLRAAPAPDEWSANDVLAHLRACADMWGGYIAAMLTQDAPTLRAINPVTWMKQTDYLDLEFRLSLRAFATQRADLLALLRSLAPDDWGRSATVTGAGRPLTLTVLSYGQRLARHERPHIKQIARVVTALRAE